MAYLSGPPSKALVRRRPPVLARKRAPRPAYNYTDESLYHSPGLEGVALAAPLIGKAIGKVGGVFGGLFGGNKKDPGRLQSNAKYDAECRSGDQDACTALQYMSGRFGMTKQGRYCNQGGCSGWATKAAKDDAFRRWSAIGGAAKPGAPAVNVASAPAAVGTSGNPIIDAAQGILSTITGGAVGGSSAQSPVAVTPSGGEVYTVEEGASVSKPALLGGMSMPVLLGLGALGVVMLSRNK